MRLRNARCFCLSLVLVALPGALGAEEVLDIGSRRELFLDRYLIAALNGTTLKLHRPVEKEAVLRFDKPWEGRFCGYVTVIKDGEKYRAYYRGLPVAGRDGSNTEVTCYAESDDGVHWTKPNLGLFEVHDTRDNNVILAAAAPCSHNFSPFIDRRPGVPPERRYKALAGTSRSGLVAFVSADGIRWRKLREEPVVREGAFDSQNVSFWSTREDAYVCFFRTWHAGFRRISKTTSKDFVHWTPAVRMEYSDGPIEHLYTNQTSAYYRAPHLYVSIAARFLPGRQVLSAAQAKAIDVDHRYFRDCSDAVLMSTRAGNRYDRTFLEGFVRPAIGVENWVSRTNYPALNVVPIGDEEMSFYVQRNYGQLSGHLRRYALRVDGFVSVNAPYAGGQMVTRTLKFAGERLLVNFSTSAPGGIRVEILDADGRAIPGYTLEDTEELIGNEIERAVRWKGGSDVGKLSDKPIRLRFVMKDADLFSLRFE